MSDEALKGPSSAPTGWKAWSLKKKLLILGGLIFAIIALAVGLGVGLGIGLNNGNDEGEEGSGEGSTPTTPGNNTGTAKWQPAVGSSWQIVLANAINDTSVNATVYDIDLFLNNKSTIDALHAQDRKVICYFSAGSYENWRPDKEKFKSADLGKVMDGWPDEKWINISSPDVRSVMTDRLDMAVAKGCDGVDPDNVDGYDNKNGLDLTQADSIDYMNWLAKESHARNMSIGLKNAGSIINSVIGNMQWSVNEQCAEYDECDTYAVFTEQGKPVFHIEYPKGDDTNNNINVSSAKVKSACDFQDSGNFSTVIKNMNLNNWIQAC